MAIDEGRRGMLRATAFATLGTLGTLGLAGLSGCAVDGTTGRVRTSPAPVPVRVSILDSSPGVGIGERYAGLSYEKAKLGTGFFSAGNSGLVALLRSLGPGHLRLGGNTVDLTQWTARSRGATPGQVAPTDLVRLAGFLMASDWKVLYGINLGTNTPERAAAEAGEANRLLGDRLAGFEIGNEPDLFRFNGLRATTYGFADYFAEWQRYCDAIRARVPAAFFSGPASSFDVEGFALPLARAPGPRLGELGQHYYRADGEKPSSTLALLLARDAGLDRALETLAATVRNAGIPGGFRYTEVNSFYHGGRSQVSDSFGAALWAIDFLFRTAQAGCSGVNFHGGGTTAAYTPLVDNDVEVLAVRPEFYALTFFAQAGRGRLVETAIEDTALNMSAYALERGAGGFALVLSNKEEEQDIEVTLDIGRARAAGRQRQAATVLHLAAPALAAVSGTLLGEAAIAPDGAWIPVAQPDLSFGVDGIARIALRRASALLLRTG